MKGLSTPATAPYLANRREITYIQRKKEKGFPSSLHPHMNSEDFPLWFTPQVKNQRIFFQKHKCPRRGGGGFTRTTPICVLMFQTWQLPLPALFTVLFGLYRLLQAPKGLMSESERNSARYQWWRPSYKVTDMTTTHTGRSKICCPFLVGC
jgi:hypothetical protein